MARAKRTERAEARRRHRAQVLAETAPADDESGDEPAEPDQSRATRVRAPQPPAGPAVDAAGRLTPIPVQTSPGFLGAMRGAYMPWRPVEDLKLLRPLVTRTHAVWIPALLAVIAGALMVSRVVVDSPWLFAFAGFVLVSPSSPAMAGPFIAGVLTPRAGWLAGLLASLSAYIVSVLLLATGNLVVYFQGSTTPAVASPSQTGEFALASLTLLPFGAAVGAFAAWYKRFLALSSPRRQQQRVAAKGGARPASKRPSATARPAARRR